MVYHNERCDDEDSESNSLQAKSFMEQALLIQLREEDKHISTSLSDLGHICTTLKDLRTAKEYLTLALVMQEQAFGMRDYKVGVTVMDLGVLYDEIREFTRANRLMERAVAVFQRTLGKDHEDVAHALFTLGCNCWKLGRLRRAQACIKRAIAILANAPAGTDIQINCDSAYHVLAAVSRRLFAQMLWRGSAKYSRKRIRGTASSTEPVHPSRRATKRQKRVGSVVEASTVLAPTDGPSCRRVERPAAKKDRSSGLSKGCTDSVSQPAVPAQAESIAVTFRRHLNGEAVPDLVLTGVYERLGESNGGPLYRKRSVGGYSRDVMVYFWDSLDDHHGWWFGSEVGGGHAWAHNPIPELNPPSRGWRLFANEDADELELVVTPRFTLQEHLAILAGQFDLNDIA